MRVKPPGSGAPPVDETSGATGPTGPTGVGTPEGAPAVAATSGAQATGTADAVAEVARKLRAGEITPREAVELLIDDAVSRQVGHATADRPALADELKDILRRYTETDPYLSSKVRRLGKP
ncbi:MAG: hypothetical protein EXR72_16955 [Myxococcales bacterium]|nr:hypothetical protein [Myxococcales bacterium]